MVFVLMVWMAETGEWFRKHDDGNSFVGSLDGRLESAVGRRERERTCVCISLSVDRLYST